MAHDQCQHLVWLERVTPQYGETSHWLVHNDGGAEPPTDVVSEDLIFNYCPMCGMKLR